MNSLNNQIYSVTQITEQMKQTLSKSYSKIWVLGEISQCTLSSSGHFYFTLKDEFSILSAVLFKGSFNQLDFNPKVGQKVECFGSINIYPPSGRYQLIIEQTYPLGDGQLAIALQEIKDKLHKEGLFDEYRKKKLPMLIQKIAVITSPTSAALQDFLKTIQSKFRHLDIIIYPSLMQGESAISNILENLNKIKKNKQLQVIVLCRGGGSKEDLIIFNDEKIARSIAECDIPVITAIGHEIDTSICDLVADISVATPTSAAKLICEGWQIFIEELNEIRQKIRQEINYKINNFTKIIEQYPIERFKNLIINKVNYLQQNLFFATDNLHEKINSKIRQLENNLNIYRNKIEDISPLKTLQRGFAIISHQEKKITTTKKLKKKDKIKIQLHDGKVNAEIL